jgi:flagellar biosynthetic protein FlhB
MAGEKTEKPTPKRLKKGRKDGSATMRTPELASWAGLLVASVLVPRMVENGTGRLRELLIGVMAVIKQPEVGTAMPMIRDGLDVFVGTVAPLVIPLVAVGLACNAAQGGVHVAAKQFKPQFKRLNPFTGLKRMFGPQGIWELVKTLLKTAILALVVYRAVSGVIPVLAMSGALPLSTIVATVWHALVSLMWQAAAAGLLMAAADYAVIRRRVNKGLRMSKQDIKDEHKQSEGDPHMKGAIRSRQMAMGRNRMMAQVADADVVMVNPTHVAVALKYDPEKGAPRVVAKGAGAVATKIRALAEENRVPMVQDVPLARTLYRACEVNQAIPAELFTAVARVLAFVMALRTRGSAAGTHRNPHSESMPEIGRRRRPTRGGAVALR